MVGTRMRWQNGWGLDGRYHGWDMEGWGLGGRYHGWDMDALTERMGSGWTLSWLGHGCFDRTDGTWALGGRCHGWDMDAPAERMGSGWPLSCLGHGCSGRTDGVWVDVIKHGCSVARRRGPRRAPGRGHMSGSEPSTA